MKEPKQQDTKSNPQSLHQNKTPDKTDRAPRHKDLDRFAGWLYAHGKKEGVTQAFSGTYLETLDKLLDDFTHNEITHAWIEHVEGCTDPFEKRQAVQRFCTGACRTIVMAQREWIKPQESATVQ